MHGAPETQHDLLRGRLNGAGEVHLTLSHGGFRLARRAAEKGIELRVGHREPGRIVEVTHIQAEGAVVLQIQQLIENQIGVLGLAVGRESHELVLTGVDLETGEVGKGRVQHAERVWEVDLPLRCQALALAKPDRGRGPLPYPIHAQDRRALERAREESRGGMGLMMLGEHQARKFFDLAPSDRGELVAQEFFQVKLFFEPDRHCGQERAKAARRIGEIGLEQAVELKQWLVVEDDVVDLLQRNLAFGKTVLGRMCRKPRIVLLARKSLLLRRRN